MGSLHVNKHISEIKDMVVLPSIQAVYDFGQILRARAKIQKTALGKPFVIGSIFSLRY
jgi:hypothetical protein